METNKTDLLIQRLKEYYNQDASTFEFNCSMFLAGDSNNGKRVDLIQALTGNKRSTCGFHACVDVLRDKFTQTSLF